GWSLDLPGPAPTRDDLARQLDATLALLATTPDDDDTLYFFRLALAHEDMHHEAALHMAQALGLALDDPRWQPDVPSAAPPRRLHLPAGRRDAGRHASGFAFDNERPALAADLDAF